MLLDEFSIIETFFQNQQQQRDDVVLNSGDDCALLKVPNNKLLAVSTDTLVAGVHFFEDMPPEALGYKSLAVNLSDLAAMGAEPAWVTMNLTLPSVNEKWLTEFATGFYQLANRYQVNLVGGDLTKGPLSITLTVHGFVDDKNVLRRDAARPGDFIYVSGMLGDAGAALKILQSEIQTDEKIKNYLIHKLYYPKPRIELGKKLNSFANAAIDISDGLVGDLSHILKMSEVGAILFVDQLPLSKELKSLSEKTDIIKLALTAGDDYELCFTISEKNRDQTIQLLNDFDCTCIGKIDDSKKLKLINTDGSVYKLSGHSYLHFSNV